MSQQDSQLLRWACGLSVSLVLLPLFIFLAFLGVPWPPVPVLLSEHARVHLPDQAFFASLRLSGAESCQCAPVPQAFGQEKLWSGC